MYRIAFMAIFLLILVSCSYNANYSTAKVIEGNRTHFCKIYDFDNVSKQVAECKFDTEFGKLKGIVVYDNGILYLYNKETNQAVYFNEMRPINGFVFQGFETDANITYEEKGRCNKDFSFNDDTELINSEEMIYIV